MLFSQLALLSLAAVLTNASPITRRQDTTCATGVNIVHARGSTESQAEDETLSVVNRLLSAIPGSIETDVDYPAAIISEDSFYSTSVAQGIDDLIDKIETYVDACGDAARIVLLGYSQGGNVVSSALAGGFVHPIPLDPRYKPYIKAAAVFADPTHAAGQSYNAGDADGSGIFKRIWPSLPVLNTYASVYRDYCGEGDFFCDAGGSLDVHYAAVDTYGDDAADWIIGLVGS